MSDDARLKLLRRKYYEKAVEAAFDDLLDEVEEAFDDAVANKAPLAIDPAPPKPGSKLDKEDSILGEAACGNAVKVMQWCLDKGASPNYVGKHNRTPLHRACNNDAVDAVKLLLEAGADPRMLVPQEREEPSDEFPNGRIVFHDWDPAEVDGLRCRAETKAVLKAWNIAATFAKLQDVEAGAARSSAAAAAEKAKVAEDAATTRDGIKAQYEAATQALSDAIKLREQRILEYDTVKCEKSCADPDRLAMLLDLVKKAEEAAREKEVAVKLLEPKYRQARSEAYAAQAAAKGEDPDACYDMSIVLSQLEDVVAGTIAPPTAAAKGKHVTLLIDRTGNALTFLTYRAVGIFDLGNSHHMSPKQLRLSVIAALRYGKPMLINVRNRDFPEAFVTVKEKFDACEADMFDALIKNNARDPAVFQKWITADVVAEHPEYEKRNFIASDTERFRFLMLTHEERPADTEVLGQFLSVLVE